MTPKLNNKGYALVLTLMILVVFMVMALYLMGRSYSSTKQNEVVEENYQSAALAEMGVTQYKLIVKDAYEKSKGPIEEKIASDPDLASDNMEIIEELECEMKKQLGTLTCGGDVNPYYMSIDDKGLSTFTIQDFAFNREEGKLIIGFASTGEQEGEMTNLHVSMTIPVDAEDGFSEEGEPVFDFIKLPPDIDQACIDPGDKKVQCDKVVLDKNSSYPGNNGKIDKDLLYAKNDLTLSSANNFDYSKIHVEKDFTVKKNMQNAKKVYIEVKGKADFQGHLDASESDIYVQLDMTVEKQLTLLNHSILFVGGNLTIDGKGNGNKLDVSNNSKMCIGGNLKGYPTADIDGKIYMKGTDKSGRVELDPKSTGVGNIEFLDEDTFNHTCGQKSIWGEMETDVKYEYN
ncbi:hypothetical protein LCM10_09635 [Rossellomorea aquimaris]|uniref:hypothetical protein n=1 Tax=Rossellomorea aquimaris TaxID=189382 RepID=UPI001CD640DB|nr:hypothetical protein [Rossellomorea aquimaris]MCA1055244.1 hypothetical protein [Rossellomorea aquimaris]